MIPSGFPQSNHVFDKPADMDRDSCDALSVELGIYQDLKVPIVQSCWKLTKDELEEVNRTGRIWLCVCGTMMPPVILSAERLELTH